MQEMRIAVAGGDVFCVSAGAASQRPPLLLLHGWTLDHRIWAAQLAAFGSERLVLAPDRRGFGRSSAPADQLAEIDDILRLLGHFAIPRAFILGMSQAGRVAIEAARRAPERIAGLVLYGARIGAAAAAPEIPIAEYSALVAEGRLGEMKARWLSHPLMHTTNAATRARAGEMLAAYDGRDLLAADALGELDTAALSGVAAPTLVLTGARDTPMRRAAARALVRLMPSAERIEIDDAGHLCNLDQPAAFNAALREFLARAA